MKGSKYLGFQSNFFVFNYRDWLLPPPPILMRLLISAHTKLSSWHPYLENKGNAGKGNMNWLCYLIMFLKSLPKFSTNIIWRHSISTDDTFFETWDIGNLLRFWSLRGWWWMECGINGDKTEVRNHSGKQKMK